MAAQPLPPLPTPQQAELIGSTWAVVKESVGLQAAGEAFFKTLFAAHPEALGLFTKFKDEDPWQQSASFKAHALTVMATIDTAFGMLGDLDTLMPVLRKLGARHVGYGAQPEHYDWVGSALVSTLQGALGASVMTGAATEAYVTVYTVVKAVMLQPADEQQPQPQRTVATKDIPAPPEVLTAAGPPVHKQMMKRSTSFKDGVVAPSPAVQPTSAPFSLVKQRRASMVKAGLIPTKRGSPMVWVGNIPPMADDEAVKGTLCAALSKFGEVRRVYPRRKATANGTWSFVLFRSTTMADKAVAAEVCIADEAGKDVQLRVERPRVNQELFKSQPGILIDVVQHVLQDKHTVKPAAQPLPPLPTPQQAELIGSTWAVVKESVGLQAAGEAFFKTLFAAHPEALGLFTKFKDDDPWQQSASFKAHTLTVMTTIDTAFGMLGDLDTLMPVLRKLGARHVGYGAQPEHYDWVGSALVSTLQGALGASVMTGAATEAYVTVYTVVKAVMLQPGGMSPAPSKSDSTSVIDGSLEKHQALRAKYVKAKSMSDLLELEDTDALSPEQRSGRELWARVKASDDPDRGLSEGIPPQSVAVVAPDSQSSAAVAALAQNDEQNQLAAKSAIASKLDEVRAEERKITPILKALVSLYEGELAGLEHRFKSETSLFRKVMARLDKGIEAAAQELGVAAPKADEILESILDVLRFCAIFPTKTYTMSVKAVMAALKERGLTELRCKNYWGPGDGYQGINSVFISNSVAFELQVRIHSLSCSVLVPSLLD
jgi:hemoglobin-like flavoprotein